jgi:hypothetical protein
VLERRFAHAALGWLHMAAYSGQQGAALEYVPPAMVASRACSLRRCATAGRGSSCVCEDAAPAEVSEGQDGQHDLIFSLTPRWGELFRFETRSQL